MTVMQYKKIALSIIKREILISYRKRTEYIYPLLFFLMIAVLFPLATTSNPHLLQVMGPGIIWVAALLATLLSLNHLFLDDYADGCLEQMILSDISLTFLIIVKLFAQWLVFIMPLIMISPVLAIFFHLSVYAELILLASLFLGTPILIFLGSIGAALTVGLRNGGMLMVLLLLPLYIPTLIFATSATFLAQQGIPAGAPLAWLGALLILTFILAPFVSAFALRIGVAYG